MQAIHIGLLGLGTVGSGAVQVLRQNATEISRRLGREVRIAAICTRNPERMAQLCPEAQHFTDPLALVRQPEIDIVVELFGGTSIAKEAVLSAIEHGKHIVTANKKLLAEYGNDIFALAEKKNVMVQFEASVAGGIPIIKTLREGLAANHIHSIEGIINGTSNFILTQMREKGSTFAEALQEAQRLGYAEADPTFDIEGHDAGHKITIMSALAFGTPINFDACYLEGISHLHRKDIQYAEELGYRIKLLGITRKTEQGIELRVHPALIPESYLLANVNGVMNAVRVNADMVGETLYYGAGAGALPTASAVVSDIMDIARLLTADSENRVPHLAFQTSQVNQPNLLDINHIRSSYYLRMQTIDKEGILGKIATILANHHVSIEALIQKGVVDNQKAEIVILTHNTVEKNIKNAMREIETQIQNDITLPIVMIRMEAR